MKKKTSKPGSEPGSAKTPRRARSVPSARVSSQPAPRPESDDNGANRAARHEAIAARAYQIYLTRGGGHGRDLEDWIQAERELGDRLAS